MGAFKDFAFKEEAFHSRGSYGSWSTQRTFTYEAGATVFITPSIVGTVPEGSFFRVYCGSELDGDYTQLFLGQRGFVLFESEVSGDTTLFIKLELETYVGISPEISSLSLLIEQRTTLYTVAKQVLVDALTPTNTGHYIDPVLQNLTLDYAWLENMSHRKALARIAQAAGGVCYQDRLGTVRIEAGSWLLNRKYDDAVEVISADRILNMESPANEVRNSIEIMTKPYEAQSEETVWTLSGDKNMKAGEVKTFVASFKYDAAVDCRSVLTGAGASIVAEQFYFNKASITVQATSTVTISLAVLGKPLLLTGSRIIVETEGESIRRYGKKSLAINDNNLIQSSTTAELIAESAIEVLSSQMRDIQLDWRGDPTLELGDVISIRGEHAAIVSQEFNFNGALNSKSKVRRL
jgi:hypothetical protein